MLYFFVMLIGMGLFGGVVYWLTRGEDDYEPTLTQKVNALKAGQIFSTTLVPKVPNIALYDFPFKSRKTVGTKTPERHVGREEFTPTPSIPSYVTDITLSYSPSYDSSPSFSDVSGGASSDFSGGGGESGGGGASSDF